MDCKSKLKQSAATDVPKVGGNCRGAEPKLPAWTDSSAEGGWLRRPCLLRLNGTAGASEKLEGDDWQASFVKETDGTNLDCTPSTACPPAFRGSEQMAVFFFLRRVAPAADLALSLLRCCASSGASSMSMGGSLE